MSRTASDGNDESQTPASDGASATLSVLTPSTAGDRHIS